MTLAGTVSGMVFSVSGTFISNYADTGQLSFIGIDRAKG
jgi:hypothetical protein